MSYSTQARTTGASLLGLDEEKDLAVIKIAAKDLPAAEFGDSDALTVGDTVYAIGNPLGVELRGTLTDGIVSAINRDVDVDGITMTLIQTNAALNSGNSGGPLSTYTDGRRHQHNEDGLLLHRKRRGARLRHSHRVDRLHDQ